MKLLGHMCYIADRYAQMGSGIFGPVALKDKHRIALKKEPFINASKQVRQKQYLIKKLIKTF